ncbi:DUF4244 domain-containing protein [Arsenicicoccus dermatophilus]|uniref:DUF4244 domain-containing protein n=1 Tax=Arsenicicoccus dermatophilus TaxID=1076331 RepID=UPI001F4C9DDB|nr:DUF4244 domain-containing protein [Arsenicicoccus dermatophilus]MCH8613945.1 DUF4244 domain-containing protein [Arsenicicoccus dermatophilus]
MGQVMRASGLHGRCHRWWSEVVSRARRGAEAGMTTAEYAVGTIAAVAFAATLIAIVRSDAVRSALTGIITAALATRG